MIKINKKYNISSIYIYTKYTNFYNKNKFLINKFFSFYNYSIFYIQKKKKKAIFLRSPKHFNIGKNQYFFFNTSVVFYKKFNINNINFTNFKKLNLMKINYIFTFLPYFYINHLKILCKLKITFI